MENTISVYIDSEYRCHSEPADGLREILTDSFVGREDQIPNFRLIPHISDYIALRQYLSDSSSETTDTFNISAINGQYYVALVGYDGTPRGTRAYEIECVV